jgi:type VI secretion system Hcp family effector
MRGLIAVATVVVVAAAVTAAAFAAGTGGTASDAAAKVIGTMKISGVTGDAPGGRIEIEAFSWGVTQPSSATGSAAGKPKFANLTVVKAVDVTTPRLTVISAMGQHVGSVELKLVDGRHTIVLTDVVIAAVVPGLSPPSPPSGPTPIPYPLEEVSFSFAKIQLEHRGKNGTVKGGWDLKTNRST